MGNPSIMKRKDLEIILSSRVKGFRKPKIELEQYATPPRIAANLVYWAFMNGHIENLKVADFCAGTGRIGIAAELLNGKVTYIEIDDAAIDLLKLNLAQFDFDYRILNMNALKVQGTFDTVLLNPPFSIQQKDYRDINFIMKAISISPHVYCILDGSISNQRRINKFAKKNNIVISEMVLDKFELENTFFWHSSKVKLIDIMMLHLERPS